MNFLASLAEALETTNEVNKALFGDHDKRITNSIALSSIFYNFFIRSLSIYFYVR